MTRWWLTAPASTLPSPHPGTSVAGTARLRRLEDGLTGLARLAISADAERLRDPAWRARWVLVARWLIDDLATIEVPSCQKCQKVR
jgi:hypothetical protein